MFDIESRRRTRHVGGRKAGAGPRNTDYYSDESDLGGGEVLMSIGVEVQVRDGRVRGM